MGTHAKMMAKFWYPRLYYCIQTIYDRLLLRMPKMEMDWNLKKLAIFLNKSFQALSGKDFKPLLWFGIAAKCLFTFSS